MSRLAQLLERDSEALLRRWTEALKEGVAPEGLTEPELRDHIPVFVRELVAALRAGTSPATLLAAKEHGLQREELGFDVDALVREYSALRRLILDAAAAEGLTLTLPEVRVLTDVLAMAIAEGATAHSRHRQRVERAREQAQQAELRAERERLNDVFKQIPVGICINEGPEHTLTFANPAYYGLARDRGLLGKPPVEALPELRGQGFDDILDRVMGTGEPHVVVEQPALLDRHGREEMAWFNDVFTPKRDADGRIDGVIQCVFEVSELVALRQHAESARRRLLGLVENAPAFVCTLRGPRHVFELVNPLYQRLIGSNRPLVGLPVVEAVPEVVEQGFITLLDNVYATGTPFVGNETPIRLDRRGDGTLEDAYLNFVYQPTRDAAGDIDGIDVFGFDVTEQVLARQRVDALAAEVRAAKEELRLVLDALPLPVSFVTTDERYGLVNKAYEDWFGVPQASVLGRKVKDFLGDAAYAVIQPFLRRGLAGERFSFEQHGVPYRHGGARDVKVEYVPHRDPAGAVDGIVALVADITLPRRLEREREQSALQRTEVLESMGDAFFALDRDWRILLVNKPFERLVNRPRGELLGRPLREVVPEADGHPSAFTQAYRRCMDEGIEARVAAFYPPLGQWLEVRVYPSATGIAVFIRDVSSDKKAEQTFLLQAQFEQQLIGIVSHDLRNPLNVIQMASSLLTRRDDLSEAATKNVVRIQNATERATRLVRDLLDFTQARLGGGIHVERQPSDFRVAVTTAIEEIEIAHPNRHIEVRLEGDLHGDWDLDRLAQVVQNLVTNALKYSPDATTVQVLAQADLARGEVVLAVHNEGAPIPVEKLPAIFEPYERAAAQLDKSSRSVGLGLYIVNEVVAAHGGRVDVTSTEAEGTTFTVRLPNDRSVRPASEAADAGGLP